MITFTNGTEMSFQEAADLMRAEPYGLITGLLIDEEGHRCAGGVLLGSYRGCGHPRFIDHSWWGLMVHENNFFVGTPEERAEHMAQWFESL